MKNKKIILGCLLAMHCSLLAPSHLALAKQKHTNLSQKEQQLNLNKHLTKIDNSSGNYSKSSATPDAIQLRMSSSENNYKLNKTNEKIVIDHTMKLSVSGLEDDDSASFSSSDSDIVSLSKKTDSSCVCKGKSVGEAVVTVKIKRSFLFITQTVKTLKCKIEVTPQAVSIRIQNPNMTLKEGETKKITVTLKPVITSEKPKFSSSNPDIATVSSKGIVTGKSQGTAIITAKIENGDFATCTVKVKNN